jgi:branched-chain amino acid transport system permease protein
MDNIVFQANSLYAFGGSLPVDRVSLFGYGFGDTGAYVFLMVAVFVLVALGLLALRRGPVGRLLIALRDSPVACGTLGLNQRWFRVAVFSVSAGIAGLGGALLAGLHEYATAADFDTFQSLPLLLTVVVAGVTSMSGALVGGFLLMLLPVIQATDPSLSGLVFLVIGGGALLLGRDPNGLMNVVYRGLRSAEPYLPMPARLRARTGPRPPAAPTEVESAPEKQVVGHGVA